MRQRVYRRSSRNPATFGYKSGPLAGQTFDNLVDLVHAQDGARSSCPHTRTKLESGRAGKGSRAYRWTRRRCLHCGAALDFKRSKNPMLMTITNPCRRRSVNPILMTITNPLPKRVAKPKPKKRRKANPRGVGGYDQSAITKTSKAFKKFHMTDPTHGFEMNIPNGWPKVFVMLGEVEKFEVQDASGKKHKKVFKGKRPILATTAGMKQIYIFSTTKLGFPSGKAVRIDYKVPADSGRNKWASRWYHPHDTHPSVFVHSGGRAAKVSGRGLKINRRGIIG